MNESLSWKSAHMRAMIAFSVTTPDVETADEAVVPVVVPVGTSRTGVALFGASEAPGELVLLPLGAAENAVALRVAGASMRGLADEGSLIYFEDPRTVPTTDMLGHVVVVETDAHEVLVNRLLRGSRDGCYDLESLDAPPRRDVRLRWAAHISAIIPPYQARRIIVCEP